ncbi:metallophosphoesterase [Albibacterium sp.]|uniref:metallophosphoesterase n=1 Tax=Albibacterium sp. TaxID=2952885 RepID=UPI002B764EE9|nr:metallophosphoesterase [Albibacterium sp.]
MSPIILSSVILILLDVYIYTALRATKIKWARSKIFTVLWWGYSAVLFLGILGTIYLDLRLDIRSIILVALFITFATKFVFALIMIIDDIRRGGVWLSRKVLPGKNVQNEVVVEKGKSKISRSDFLAKSGIVLAAVPFTTLSWGIVSGAYDYRIRRQKLYLPNLPKAFHGMKIGQISDIHSGSFYNKTAVQGGVDMLLAEKPDVIFFTGDLVNNLASELKDYKDIFSKVKAPLGVYSILGNHDYGEYHFGLEPSAAKARNLELLKQSHHEMDWDLLLNENRKIKVDNEEIGIIGIENWGAGFRFPKYGDLDKALKGSEDVPVKLLLSHDPSHWRAQVLARPEIDVMFSGHTHGMQFGVRFKSFQWSPVQYIYKEWAGLYQENKQQLYVNTGYGFLGYPGRVGILPEITIFELMSGDKPS